MPKEAAVQSRTQRRMAWLSIILSLGVVAAACGSDDDAEAGGDSETSEEGAASSGDVSGEINISGSSTVEPISVAVGEAFMGENAEADVRVDGPGTGDGFELFCSGQTDISDASRPIEEDEVTACEENGVEYVELQIAYDGITVMTNPANEAVECLSFADLYALIGPEATGSNWSDGQAIASELGSETQLPDAELSLIGPGPESGTYDSFIELALSGIAEERGLPEDQVETTRSDYESSPNDNAIIEGIGASDTSLGWVGFAYAEQAGDGVKELGVSAEPNGECVTPDADTIADGSYPLARPLFIYVSKASIADNPAVQPFVDFYLGNLETYVEDTGYVPLPEDQASETTSAWEGA
jgi:phosphate transport system substrate-binding protein